MQDKNIKSNSEYEMHDIANSLTKNGLSVIPVNNSKQPTVPTWKPFQVKIPDAFQITDMFQKNTFGIAIIAGKVSGNLEVIDEDLKYDTTGIMHDEFVSLVKNQAPGLFEKLIIQKTVSGGHHYIYRCAKIESNLKLASRPATEEEQVKYPKEKQKALYETRGEGGYFVCNPTYGYEIVQGSFDTIYEITEDEREILFSIASSFDQCQKEFVPPKQKPETNFTGLSPFEDFNHRGDAVSLLEKHGWTISYTKGSKTFLKRPGDTKTTQSANFDKDKNWFTVFSTSTEFDSQKAYLPYAVFTILECNGDFSKAAKELYNQGYGERQNISKTKYDKFFKNATTIDADFDGSSVVINSIELLKIDVEENRYLMPPILPRIGTAVLAGSPDTGKSQLARQLCEAIATGMNHFLDHAIEPVHKRALYIATEDDSHNTNYLCKKQLQGLHQTATANLSFIFADVLSQEEILLAMDIELTKNPCDLVVVDSFGDIFQGTDSNNTISMRKNVKCFDYFAKKHKCLILFVHHINKGAYTETPHQKNIMGGGGLTQKVRFAWQLTKGPEGQKYLTVVKGNYCPREHKENSWVLSFSEENFIFTNTSAKIPTESINVNSDTKDTKFSKLISIADSIFGNETISYKVFCERYETSTGKSIASAKRDHKSMKELDIIIQEKETEHWKLNGSVNNQSPGQEVVEPAPF